MPDRRCGEVAAAAVPTAAMSAPTAAAAVASAAAEAAMTAVADAGVLRPEAEEETGAADTGAGAEAALGKSEYETVVKK